MTQEDWDKLPLERRLALHKAHEERKHLNPVELAFVGWIRISVKLVDTYGYILGMLIAMVALIEMLHMFEESI